MCNRRILFGALIIAVALISHADNAKGQLIDGFEFGVGLSMYGGDLDGNPNSDLPSYVGSGRLAAYAGVDRDMGSFRVSLLLSVGQLRGTNAQIDGRHTVLASDVLLGYRVVGPIAVYAGIGPALLVPDYARTTANAVLDEWAVDGSHFALTFPVGVLLQDRVRIGLRLTNSDMIDGYRGGASKDILGQFTVGYRLRLN